MLNCAKRAYDFNNVLLQPSATSKINSRKEVDLGVPSLSGGVPIIAANMKNIGNFQMAAQLQKHKVYTAIQKSFTLGEWDEAEEKYNIDYNFIIPTVGADAESINRFLNIYSAYADVLRWVCFDVANGHTEENILIAKKLKDQLPDHVQFIYGNVANPFVMNFMDDYDFHPHFIKIGIGSGSVCTTRLKTGVGVPQATLIDNFESIQRKSSWHPGIISDGGCRTPADLVKSFVLGADMVMIGGMLAFHEEGRETGGGSDGDRMFHYGNSSEKANGYDPTKSYRAVEGKVVSHSAKPSVNATMTDILGGIRSACTYLNCPTISDLGNRRSQIMIVDKVADNY